MAEPTGGTPVSRRRALGLFAAVGAGITGVVAAVRQLGSYGPAPQVAEGTVRTVEAPYGEWWVPPGADGPLPTVVLVHGGYWRRGFDRSLEDALAADLAARGFLVWNLDYRPSTEPWPTTLADAAAAYDHLLDGAHADRVDPSRLAVAGHSAGGHLALWLAARSRLPSGAVGADPRGPAPVLCVPQAPVADLRRGAAEGLGGGAVVALLGGTPEQVPDRYAVADPSLLLPSGVRTVVVHGRGDDVVPLSQGESFVAAARAAGDDTSLVVVPGGHFEHLDPASAACAALRDALADL